MYSQFTHKTIFGYFFLQIFPYLNIVFYFHPLISERLKTALEENDITGAETMEINAYIL